MRGGGTSPVSDQVLSAMCGTVSVATATQEEAQEVTTKIVKPFRREVLVRNEPHTLVIDGSGVRVYRKLAKRRFASITWGEVLAIATYRGDL